MTRNRTRTRSGQKRPKSRTNQPLKVERNNHDQSQIIQQLPVITLIIVIQMDQMDHKIVKQINEVIAEKAAKANVKRKRMVKVNHHHTEKMRMRYLIIMNLYQVLVKVMIIRLIMELL